MRLLLWALISSYWCPFKNRKRGCPKGNHTRKKDVRRRGPSTSQGDRLQKPNLMPPWSGNLSLQNCEKINLCCFSYSACGILLWQPELTNTGPICYLSRVTRNLSWMDFPFPSSSWSWKILDHASLTEKMKLRSKEFPPSHPLPFLVLWRVPLPRSISIYFILISDHFPSDEAGWR